MHIPSHFAETDIAKLHAFIRAHSFGILISNKEATPFASHLPFMLDAARGEYGTLRCHVARANPHWRALAQEPRTLAIFHGPHAYISPTWYKSEGVPTWSYAAVHVYGRAQILATKDQLRALLDDLVEVNETANGTSYRADHSAPKNVSRMNAIVGIEIAIEKIEGKYKISQNRPQEDHAPVIERLRERAHVDDLALAQMMEGYYKE